MTDEGLFSLVKATLANGWPLIYGDAAPLIAQAWQPRAEGISSGPALYMTKVGDVFLGTPRRATEPDPEDPKGVIRVETQVVETTLQLMAIWDAVSPLAAGDLAARAAALLRSDLGLDALRAGGCGMLRITQVRNPKFVDGADEFRPAPNFDFTLTRNQITLTKHPAATLQGLRTYPV